MRNFKTLTLIFVFVSGSFIVKAQQTDSINQKLDEYSLLPFASAKTAINLV